MTLQRQQDLLAALYTDPEVRGRFRGDPRTVGASFGLSEVESDQLAAVSAEDLHYFSNSLFWKRLHEVEKVLPLTKEFLPDRFEPLFREFSNGFVPVSIDKHLEDALNFLSFVLRESLEPLQRDAIRYEQAGLEFYGRRRNFVVRALSHNLVTRRRFRVYFIRVWVRVGKREFVR